MVSTCLVTSIERWEQVGARSLDEFEERNFAY